MKRVCSLTLALLLILTVLPMSVLAAGVGDSLGTVNFTVVDNDHSTLAPGVELDELVLYNENNQRVEMYVTTVDMTVDTVQVKANYKDNQNAVFGMQPLSEQVAAMEANYEEPFKIVAGINASYYNTTTGQPTGAFVMEGKDASATGDSYAYFAVLKDGSYMIGKKGTYSQYKDQMQEAIGGWQHIVIDGAVASGLNKTDLYPRQTLGLTADGKLILMTADGSQAPTTVGLTVQEQAEIMLALGCVDAIHLDGGNSATFGIIPEGEEEFVTKNSPSGGAERAVSNTLMIISTAVPDGTFDHAVITGDYDYYAPNSTYTFSAFGVDATNAAAEIPETAVWALSDDSFGTISNGKFVSNGKLGKVDIQMTDGGRVVGTKSIEIVEPTSAGFALTETTVPYGKSVEIAATALYGNFDMYTDASHYDFVVNPAAAGTMDGFEFTAAEDDTVTSAVVTATYKYAEGISDSITVKFGKGSEVLFDFEDGDISDWRGLDTIDSWIAVEETKYPDTKHPIVKVDDYSNGVGTQDSTVFLATEEQGGHVKNGQYALGVTIDRLNAAGVGSWLYNYIYYTGDAQVWRDVANGKSAVRVGMWVHLPQEATNTAFRICRTFSDQGVLKSDAQYMTSDYDGKKVSYNTDYAIPESGWIYVYFDLTAYDFQSSTQYDPDICYAENYRSDRGHTISTFPAFIQFINGDKNDTMEELTLYIDDITLDYSDVTEDRDAPIISDMEVCADTANFVALNGQTVDNNMLSFSAKVNDNSGNSNMTGIDYAAARIYIDGMDMSDKTGFKAANGYVTLNNVYLTNGKHDVAVVVFDKQGNETRMTKSLTVNGTAENAIVSLSGHNDGSHTPKAGSVYYVDIKASDAAQIKELTTTLKLNTANTFEYDQIICAEGVTAEVSKDPIDNELTIVLCHDGTQTGNTVLASVPVRVWAWDEEATDITADAQFASGAIPVIDIECETIYGEVTYTGSEYKNYICGFSGAMDVATELDNKTAWHKHSEYALADKAATCTENGYENRTYCDGCKSVMKWGTATEAAGHTYAVVDGKLACDCGETYTATGLVETNDKVYYVLAGNLMSGWQYVDTKDAATTGNYYFSTTDYAAVDGQQTIGGYGYTFENHLLVRGTLVTTTDGAIQYLWAGKLVENDWAIVDGNKYYFSSFVAKVGPSVIRGEDGVFAFNEQGIWQEGTGLMTVYDRTYYYENGKCKAAGLVKVDGDYYYIDANYQPVTGLCWVGKPNTAVTGYTAGEYEFGADGKLIRKVEKNGPVGDYFYIDGVMQKAYQIIEFEGDYYFVYDGHKLAKSCTLYLSEKFVAGTELTAGFYDFDADGKLVIKHGPVGDYFYLDGVRQNAYQLVKFEGDYYFVYDGHKLAKSCRLYLTDKFVEGVGLTAGFYDFDADGKIVIKNGPVGDYFYIDGAMQKAYQLVKFEGDYYFVYDGHKLAKSCTLYLSEKFVAGTELTAGFYDFDADGKIVIKNGPVDDKFYIDGIMQKAYQVVEFEGDYYFISDGHKLAKSCRLYLTDKFVEGVGLTAGFYDFDADGRMVIKNGPVGDYFYIDNVMQKAYQIIEFEGDYYFVSDANKLVKNRSIYIIDRYLAKHGLPAGTYEFNADGKMILKNGPVGDKFYINGVQQNAYQLVEFEGNYYFIGDGHRLARDCSLYLTEEYVYGTGLAVGKYSFDSTGKMILN